MGTSRDSSSGGARILRDSLRRNRGGVCLAASMLCAHQICEALVPVVIGLAVDRAIATGDRTALAVWVATLAGLFVVLSSTFRFGSRITKRVVATEAHRLRMAAVDKILHPLGIRTDLRTGELLTVAGPDADRAADLLSFVPRFAGGIAALGVCAIGLVTIHVGLGLAVLLVTPVVLALLQALAPRITRRVVRQQKSVGQVAALATDLVAGQRPLRGIGAEEPAVARYRVSSRRSLRAMVEVARAQAWFAAVALAASTILAAGVAVAAGWLALRGTIGIGELITVLGLAQFLVTPLGILAMFPGNIASALGSARRLALVDEAPLARVDGTLPLGTGPHRLTLSGLRNGSLAGVDIVVEPGEFLGVVATSPSDGDALAVALSGDIAFDEETGSVVLGGTALDVLAHADSRGALLVEPHNPDLFTGPLGWNLRAGADAADGDVVRVLRSAGAADIADLLDDHIAERGATLSGGQRQRVALARALLASPGILVLHEPTSAVDAVTEHAVAEGIAKLRHGDSARFTTIAVTSSPALLAKADRVVVIDAGVVVAEGSHAELAASQGTYRQAVLR